MNLSNISILYIEDDAIVRGIMCSLLAAKYTTIPIYSAGAAEEGLELFGKHHPSIIITDIHLAESDGIQMARSIRQQDPDTVIIFISGCPDVERLTEFEGTASCHYIRKPINYKDLSTLLDSYLYITAMPSSR